MITVNVWEKVKEVEDYIIKCRRDLHQIPEVGLNLPKTSAYVGKGSCFWYSWFNKRQ